MILRLPQFAEREFARQCSVYGALCHKAGEDENGWDYLVEFRRNKTVSGPADTQPPGQSAYVQIKSLGRGRPTCSIKLSNALKAAQSRQPWFIVLVMPSPDQGSKIYAVHVWEQLISKSLQAVRAAEYKKKALNKRRITVSFSSQDEHGGNLVNWMLSEIEAVGEEYEQKKRDIYETVGYESGYGIVKFNVGPEAKKVILQHFLGKGDGLAVSEFTFTPTRFGIPSEPAIEANAGVIRITPNPVQTCELRLRGQDAESGLVLTGNIYASCLPGLPAVDRNVRVAAQPIELLWSISGESSIEVTLRHADHVDLRTLEAFACINDWFNRGSVDIQIWVDGQRISRGSLNVDRSDAGQDWGSVVRIVRRLKIMADRANCSELHLSLGELIEAYRPLTILDRIVVSPSVRVEFEPLGEVPLKFSSLVYYMPVVVGEWTIYALIQHSVERDESKEGTSRIITCGAARVLEEYLFHNADQKECELVKADYASLVSRLEKTEVPLGLSDIYRFIEENRS
jgi:hypothetical protein